MRRILKRALSIFLVPLARWYLRKKRKSSYHGTTVEVRPGVFHPGLFHSTHFLLDYLLPQITKGQTFLELGSGTGLISIIAAKKGLTVTATDISHAAKSNTEWNIQKNNVRVLTFQSDLFKEIPVQQFDWIVINPPYYAAAITNEESYAWNAGENFEYFTRLFSSIRAYMHDGTNAVMVITLGTDLQKISSIASANGLILDQLAERKMVFDKRDFIFRIREARIDKKL